ncbi:MAG TPA: hypothetical protein DHU96_14345 [Actinobacteria bacterium]|nr:hypothetical protein [Actinomycetota bacterium]
MISQVQELSGRHIDVVHLAGPADLAGMRALLRGTRPAALRAVRRWRPRLGGRRRPGQRVWVNGGRRLI